MYGELSYIDETATYVSASCVKTINVLLISLLYMNVSVR